jgi:hypothetical protein
MRSFSDSVAVCVVWASFEKADVEIFEKSDRVITVPSKNGTGNYNEQIFYN